jgi:hypothetical protein
MVTEESSASAHPPIEDHDDTVEAHYSCLERPCACLEGWVFVGYIDGYGEEREASYSCRRCTDSLQTWVRKRASATMHDGGMWCDVWVPPLVPPVVPLLRRASKHIRARLSGTLRAP